MARNPSGVWLLASILALAAGCVRQYPQALSRRPLLIPDGEHEFQVTTIQARELRPYNRSLDDGIRIGGAYRYGVSKNVNYLFPFMWAYGWEQEQGLQLMLLGGLDGFGYGSGRQNAPTGDPRQPNARFRAVSTSWHFAGTAKLDLDDNLSTLARITAGTDFFFFRPQELGASVSVALIYDAADWLSLGTGAAAGLGHQLEILDTDPWISIGRGPASLGATPMLSVHVVHGLDVTAAPYLVYELSEDVMTAGVEFGVDWYFD